MNRQPVIALLLCSGCAIFRSSPASNPPVATVERTRSLLTALAHDSMEGRRFGTPGEVRAARFIAARFRDAGLQPAGDSGYFQRLPVATTTTRTRLASGQERVRTGTAILPSFADLDTVPRERRLTSANVIGILRGSDPALAAEVVIVGAHFDALGIRSGGGNVTLEGRPPASTDSIVNGADDDGSGTVAVLEVARMVAAGPRPKRTILFATFTGEESGIIGGRWYAQHPIVPIEKHVADIEVEMIGRPDTAAGGPGKAWLTGFERSTMGPTLAAAGLPVIADPRPAQRFFERSDNIAFARLGIVSHTLSSYGMHREYHSVNDEVEFVDFEHMTALINVLAKAVVTIANGPQLQWNPGGKP